MRTEFNTDQGIIVNDRLELIELCNYLDNLGFKWYESENFKLETLNISKGVFFEGFPIAVFPADGKWVPNLSAEGAERFLYVQAEDVMYFNPQRGDVIEARPTIHDKWKQRIYLEELDTYTGIDVPFHKLVPIGKEKEFYNGTLTEYDLALKVRTAVNHEVVITEENTSEQVFDDLVELFMPRENEAWESLSESLRLLGLQKESTRERLKKEATTEYLRVIENINNEYC